MPTSVDVSWPTTPNGRLVEIKNGGDSIYKPGPAQLVPPLLADGADRTASSNKRTLEDGDTREVLQHIVLELELSSYEVTFTRDDGTTITVGS